MPAPVDADEFPSLGDPEPTPVKDIDNIKILQNMEANEKHNYLVRQRILWSREYFRGERWCIDLSNVKPAGEASNLLFSKSGELGGKVAYVNALKDRTSSALHRLCHDDAAFKPRLA